VGGCAAAAASCVVRPWATRWPHCWQLFTINDMLNCVLLQLLPAWCSNGPQDGVTAGHGPPGQPAHHALQARLRQPLPSSGPGVSSSSSSGSSSGSGGGSSSSTEDSSSSGGALVTALSDSWLPVMPAVQLAACIVQLMPAYASRNGILTCACCTWVGEAASAALRPWFTYPLLLPCPMPLQLPPAGLLVCGV
jgi:hypothetical protein